MPSEWSDPGRVAEYLSREIPQRPTAEEMLLEALPLRVERFLDLGTGDGRMLALVRDRHPGAAAVGLDLSEPMLARAPARFGGVFANLDLVRSASPQLHERFRREIGRAEDDPTDRLADLSGQLEWLRGAGFGEVECHFKWLELALMVAVR